MGLKPSCLKGRTECGMLEARGLGGGKKGETGVEIVRGDAEAWGTGRD